MIKAFALALFAATVSAQGEMTTMDMPAEPKPVDPAAEEKQGEDLDLASVEILQSLIDIVCEPDMDHMDDEAKDEMMKDEGGADVTTMDMAATEEMKKEENHSEEDIEKMRNTKLCRGARDMLKDIVEYGSADENERRQKAEKWGGVVYDVVQDFYGDAATSMTTYGATIAAAIAVIAF